MPEFQIYQTQQFEKDLKKINSKDKELIISKLKNYIIPQLKSEPFFGQNIKKLRNYDPPTWRIRIGNYRIFYLINDELKEIDLLTIDHRKNAY